MFDLTLKNLVRFFSAVIPIIPQLLFTLNQYCSFRLPNPFVNLDESKPCLACFYVHFSCVSYKRILHVSLWWISITLQDKVTMRWIFTPLGTDMMHLQPPWFKKIGSALFSLLVYLLTWRFQLKGSLARGLLTEVGLAIPDGHGLKFSVLFFKK